MNEVGSRQIIAVFTVFALALAAAAVILLATRPPAVLMTINPPLPTATAAPTSTPLPVTVYITGALRNPQMMLSLPAGSRVEDAIEAAGGTLPDADLNRVNLAALLRDGDQIHIFAQSENVDTAQVLATPSGAESLDVNRATVEELTALPGIGPALAARIVDHREANGPFSSLDDLDAVSGVGPSLLSQIEALIRFE